jgi:hypothetical protein
MKATLAPSFRYASGFSADQKKLAKKLAKILIVAAILLFALTSIFSTARSQFQCSGKMSTKYGFRPATVFINLERPSWAMRGWGKSKGSFQLVIPKEAVDSYEILRDDGDLLEVALGDEQQFGGSFSLSINELALRTPQGLFLGSCNAVTQ